MMEEVPKLPPAESAAWQAAYDSKDAYDALEAARAKQAKYHEIAALSLDGVVVDVDEEVMTAVDREVEAAQNEFDVLTVMVGAVSMMENSPFLAGGTAARTVPEESAQSEPPEADSPDLSDSPDSPEPGRPKPSKSAAEGFESLIKMVRTHQEVIDTALVYLIDNEGSVLSENGVSANTILQVGSKVNRHEWGKVRPKLVKTGLFNFEKPSPSSKRYSSIAINEDLLSYLQEAGELSDDVLEAIERREKRVRGGQSAGAEENFLDEGAGQIISGRRLGLQSGLDDIRALHTPDKRRTTNKSKGHDKMFSIHIKAEGSSLIRRIKVKDLGKLPLEAKALIGIGQVNMPMYDCYETEEQRWDFVQRIINKGESDETKHISRDRLGKLADELQTAGYLQPGEKCPQLTREGIDFIRDTKFGKAKLATRDIGGQGPDKVKGTDQAAPATGSSGKTIARLEEWSGARIIA